MMSLTGRSQQIFARRSPKAKNLRARGWVAVSFIFLMGGKPVREFVGTCGSHHIFALPFEGRACIKLLSKFEKLREAISGRMI